MHLPGKRGRPKKSEQISIQVDATVHEPRKLRTRPVPGQATGINHVALNFPVVARSPQKRRSQLSSLQKPAIPQTADTVGVSHLHKGERHEPKGKAVNHNRQVIVNFLCSI
jgi:hypothetical protein